jgi:hypothetical protein
MLPGGGDFAGTMWTSLISVQDSMLESQSTSGKSPLFWDSVTGEVVLKYAAGVNIEHELWFQTSETTRHRNATSPDDDQLIDDLTLSGNAIHASYRIGLLLHACDHMMHCVAHV